MPSDDKEHDCNHQQNQYENTRNQIDKKGFIGSATQSKNMEYLKNIFTDDTDFISRDITILNGKSKISIMYIDGLVENDIINQYIIMRLQDSNQDKTNIVTPTSLMDSMEYKLIAVSKVYRTAEQQRLVSEILTGSAILMIGNNETALVVNAKKIEKGEKSEIESTLVSGNEAFSDDINKSFALIRKRLPTPNLKFKDFKLGRMSQTTVRVAWIQDIVNPTLKDEVFQRIERIDVDLVYSFSVITELIEDVPTSIWPQHKLTERPDVTVANLAEGRIAILCDNFPFAAIVPIFILQEFQSPDDYTQKWIVGTLARMLRYIAFFLSSTLSSIYLSFTTYNHSIIPPSLAIHISAGRKSVPFPSIVEILLMTIVIDLLREAGIRLPKALGTSIGILGAVVIGQSAVEAGYVSPVVIIVIAISAISSFAVPSIALGNVARIINYFLLVLSTIFGFFGLIIGAIFILWRIVSLRSFGISSAHPMDVGEVQKMKDVIIRAPLWQHRIRSNLLSPVNKTRMGNNTKKPSPKN